MDREFKLTSCAQPGHSPRSYASAVPDGDRRPLHLAVGEVHEDTTGFALLQPDEHWQIQALGSRQGPR